METPFGAPHTLLFLSVEVMIRKSALEETQMPDTPYDKNEGVNVAVGAGESEFTSSAMPATITNLDVISKNCRRT